MKELEVQTRMETSLDYMEVNDVNQKVMGVYSQCAGQFVGGVDRYYHEPKSEAEMMGQYSKEVMLAGQDDINFHVSYTSDASQHEAMLTKQDDINFPVNYSAHAYQHEQSSGTDKGEAQESYEESTLTPSRPVTPFDALRRKAYRLFGKFSGTHANDVDLDTMAASEVNDKQLARVGDYIVITMPLDDDTKLSIN